VTGGADLLLEAIGDLLENAFKFAPAGSTVTLLVMLVDGRFVLSVEDRGHGIPVEERNRVLRRFYRSAKSRTIDGGGLGLSLAAAVADLHSSAWRSGTPLLAAWLIWSRRQSRDANG
jgi:signal transduction histidine kinase